MTMQKLTGTFYTDELGRRVIKIERKVGRAVRKVERDIETGVEKTVEAADAVVHVTVDGFVRAEKAVVRFADKAFHIVVDAAKVAIEDVKKAGHVVVEFGAMLLVEADDLIIGAVKFTKMELHALAEAVEMDLEELVNFLAYLPEETLEALRRLDAKVVRALRHVRHELRNLPKDMLLLHNKLEQFKSETMDVDQGRKDSEALAGYYLNALGLSFKATGYSKSDNAFIIHLTDPGTAQLAPLFTAVLAPVEVDATHLLFKGEQ